MAEKKYILAPAIKDLLLVFAEPLFWLNEIRALFGEPIKPVTREEQKAIESIREATDVENVEESIELLKKSAKNFVCPICRSLHLHMIHYLLWYDAITKLREEGVPEDKILDEYEKKYKKMIEQRIEQLKKELLIDDYSFEKANERFVQMLKSVLGE
jgi:negative regulator of replication initiation